MKFQCPHCLVASIFPNFLVTNCRDALYFFCGFLIFFFFPLCARVCRSSPPSIHIAVSRKFQVVASSSKNMEGLPANRGLNQQLSPMFDITETSIVTTQFNLAIPNLRGASFSSYLQPKDPIAPTKHRAEDTEISIFEAEKYYRGVHDQRTIDEGMPSKQSDLSSVPRLSSVSSVDDGYGRNYRARSFHATPTASSEASWNSQTGLLSNPPGSVAVSIKNLPNSPDKSNKSSKWFFRCRCPCTGKKSVQVEDKHSKSKNQQILQLNRSNSNGCPLYSSNRQSSPRSSAAGKGITIASPPPDQINNRNFMARPQLEQSKIMNPNPNLGGFSASRRFPPNQAQASGSCFADPNGSTSNGFTFPILNNSTPPVKRMFNVLPNVTGVTVEDPPRDSLEIFQPRGPSQSGGRERHNLTFPASPKSQRASYDEEIGSDASSDLFEIESFSTQTTSYPRRDSLDDNSSFNERRFRISVANDGINARKSLDEPSVAPTECYAPSEVSVDWSVTTAEGFDRASLTNFSVAAASEAEHLGARRDGGKSEKVGDGGGNRRRNGLLGCRCEKAVFVGPGPIKCGSETDRIRPIIPANSAMGRRAAVAQASVSNRPIGRATLCSMSMPFSAQGI
ncbi:hypothetical protein Nepgr_022092 [Nepenthes gracilis]|uniref:Protein PHYTOCHROME KINASE SUBSTRATE 4 n=1 Tax=Nepenthes gracilis TaxID=150966 RepID=A0AAD3XY20_NEPGR|nr:hypothetical protein Nepgr_022092 [Nepenthes gracilis]